MNIEIMGPRGVGKTTLGEGISEALGITYISLGRLARQEMMSKTEFGIQMQAYLEKGIPFPEGFLVPLVSPQIILACESGGFVLDGYPRRKSESEELVAILNGLNTKLDLIIELNVPFDELVRRSRDRLVCGSCDANSKRSEVGSDNCPHCNGILIPRSDDTYEDLRRANSLYESQKDEVIDVLRSVAVYEILALDGTLAPGFIISGLIHAIGKIKE